MERVDNFTILIANLNYAAKYVKLKVQHHVRQSPRLLAGYLYTLHKHHSARLTQNAVSAFQIHADYFLLP